MSLTAKQVFDELVHDLLLEDPPEASIDLIVAVERDHPETGKWIRAKVRHLKKSKVEQKLILMKIEKDVYNFLIAGVSKVRGCKRFGPRKETSTMRKLRATYHKAKKRYLATGQRICDWRQFLARICSKHGLKSFF